MVASYRNVTHIKSLLTIVKDNKPSLWGTRQNKRSRFNENWWSIPVWNIGNKQEEVVCCVQLYKICILMFCGLSLMPQQSVKMLGIMLSFFTSLQHAHLKVFHKPSFFLNQVYFKNTVINKLSSINSFFPHLNRNVWTNLTENLSIVFSWRVLKVCTLGSLWVGTLISN